jgi:23S rRNA (cytidine1920-2'-O)/16S rRNA (cytidine1409-2'-O)-methyltransferase
MRGVPRREVPLIELLTGLFPERDPKELFGQVLRGGVTVNGQPVMKPGTRVAADAQIVVRPRPAWVSRGGGKLAAALDRWGIDCDRGAWIDAGSSTGGFTDCLLQHGAPLVYAVDVGEGQLDWRLRGDARVRVMEGTNIMDVRRSELDPSPACAVADLSFRSLRRAARHILDLTVEGRGIFLVKPQFEYADAPVDFRGVVRGPLTLRSIAEELMGDLAAEGVAVEKSMPSPLPGRKGNQELLWLLHVSASAAPRALPEGDLFLE